MNKDFVVWLSHVSYLGWAKVAVELMKALAWPIAVVTLGLFFRREVNDIARRLKSLKAPGVQVEMIESAAQLAADVDRLTTLPPPDENPGPESPTPDTPPAIEIRPPADFPTIDTNDAPPRAMADMQLWSTLVEHFSRGGGLGTSQRKVDRAWAQIDGTLRLATQALGGNVADDPVGNISYLMIQQKLTAATAAAVVEALSFHRRAMSGAEDDLPFMAAQVYAGSTAALRDKILQETGLRAWFPDISQNGGEKP